jgi:tetratricopeptide (TPR) repeat protein
VYAELATKVAREVPATATGQQLAAEELLDAGNIVGAAGTLFRLLGQAPDQPQAQAELGMILFQLGYPKAAEDRFRRELLRDSDCPLAQLGVAQLAALQGDWDSAISGIEQLGRSYPRELNRLLQLPPAGPLADAWTGGKVRLPERYAGLPAGMVWKAWLSTSDSRPSSVKLESTGSCSAPSLKALTRPGLWLTEACYQQVRDRLRTKNVLTQEERIKLVEAELRLGRFQEARQEAEGVLKSDPRNEWAIFWLSEAYRALAQESLSTVASQDPDSARQHELLAHYFISRRQYARAKSEYLAAISKAPDLSDLHLGLGKLYLHDGDLPGAEKEFQKTLELAPASAPAHYELGHLYAQQQRWDVAVKQLQPALGDPALTVKVCFDLAKALAEMGQTRQAVDALLPALKDDKDGAVHYLLAGLYRKLGDQTRAEEALSAFRRLRDASLQANRGELEALRKEGERFEDPITPESPQ